MGGPTVFAQFVPRDHNVRLGKAGWSASRLQRMSEFSQLTLTTVFKLLFWVVGQKQLW